MLEDRVWNLFDSHIYKDIPFMAEILAWFKKLPRNAQSYILKTREDLTNMFFLKRSSFLKEFTDKFWKDSILIANDIKITSFKKYDRANYYWDSEGETYLEKNIPVLSYSGTIDIKIKDKEDIIKQKFKCILALPLWACSPEWSGELTYWIEYDKWPSEVVFQKQIDDQKAKKLDMMDQINALIINNIQEHYDYFENLLENTYRRWNSEITNLPSLSEKKQYIQDLYDKLEEDNEVDSSFFYHGSWAELYRKLCRNSSYSGVIDTEDEIVKENIDYFSNMISKNNTLVDMWCGEWNKIISLIKKIELKECEYLATDSSIDNLFWLGNTRSNIHNYFPGKFSLRIQDFDKIEELKNKKKKTVFLLGWSLWNMTKEWQGWFLKKIKSFLNTWENLIFTVFINDIDSNQTKSSYEDIEVKNRIMDWLDRIWFDISNMWYEIIYKDETVYIYSECLTDQTIDTGDRKVFKQKWDKILVARSKRFNRGEVQDLISNAWLNLEKTITKKSSEMYIVSK